MPPEILSFLQTQTFTQPQTQGQGVTTQENAGLQGVFDALIAEYTAPDVPQESQPITGNIPPSLTDGTSQSQTLTIGSAKTFSEAALTILAGEGHEESSRTPQEGQQDFGVHDENFAWRGLFSEARRTADVPAKRTEIFTAQSDFDEGVTAEAPDTNADLQQPVNSDRALEPRTEDPSPEISRLPQTQPDDSQSATDEQPAEFSSTPKADKPDDFQPATDEQPAEFSSTPKADKPADSQPATDEQPAEFSSTPKADIPDDFLTVKADMPAEFTSTVTGKPAEFPSTPKSDIPDDFRTETTDTPAEFTSTVTDQRAEFPSTVTPDIPDDSQLATDDKLANSRSTVADMPDDEPQPAPKPQPSATVRKASSSHRVITPAALQDSAPSDAPKADTPEIPAQETHSLNAEVPAHESHEQAASPRDMPETRTDDYEPPKADDDAPKAQELTVRLEVADEIPDANVVMAGASQLQPTQPAQPAQTVATVADTKTDTVVREPSATQQPASLTETPKADRPSRTQPQSQRRTQSAPQEASPEISDSDSQPHTSGTQAQTHSQTQHGHDDSGNTNTPQPQQSDGHDTTNDSTASPARPQTVTARATTRNDTRNDTRTETQTRRVDALSDFQSFFDAATRAKRTSSRVNTQPLSIRSATYEASPAQSQAHTLRNGIVNTVRFIRADGVRKANIVVDPPALGRISVELTSTSSGVEASVKVASEQIRQIVQEQITQLRDNLSQQGVQVSGFTVDVQQDSGHQSQDSGGGNQNNPYSYTASDDDDDTENFRVDLEEGLLYWIA